MTKRTPEGDRITEAEMADVVEDILRRQTHCTAQFSELFDLVPKRVKLSKGDCVESDTRPGEHLWQQIVRNLKQHNRAGFEGIPGGICLEGYSEVVLKAQAKAKADAKLKAKAAKVKAKAAKAKFKKGSGARKSVRKPAARKPEQRANA